VKDSLDADSFVPACLLNRLAALAAEINAVPLEYLSGPKIPRNDVANRRFLCRYHGISPPF